MEAFHIERAEHLWGHLMILVGELDLLDADRAREALVEVTGSTVVVDVSGLTFIDSAGVFALIMARRQIEEKGDAFEIRGVHGIVQRVFEMLGMDDWLMEQSTQWAG